jgi:glucosamine--fructose-6-phosphate aminotransferase (isomerizing)
MTKFLKDIMEQPDQLLQSMEYTLQEGQEEMKKAVALIRSSKQVFISAIGASWNAGIAIQSALNEVGVQSVLCDASDFFYFTKIPPRSTVIFLSRSGRSVEIVNSLPKCKLANAAVISITNSEDSFLTASSDVCLFTKVNFDNSISVNTYTSIILTGQLLAIAIRDNMLNTSVHTLLSKSFENVGRYIPEWRDLVESIDWVDTERHSYFIARGFNLASAHESMLLWEEAAKQPAAALTTGAFRHGPQEIVNDSINIAIWLENKSARDYDVKLVNDLRGKGVNTVAIGYNLPRELKGYKIEIPAIPYFFSAVVNIIPMQMAAEKLARMKEVDPDSFLFCNFVVELEGGL